MKEILVVLAFFTLSIVQAQDKMTTNTGVTFFEASIPSFEEVKAINDKTTCVFIPKTGEFSCYMAIKDFKFEKGLMQQHFNENYMESDRFERAFFKGYIVDFNYESSSTSPRTYQIKGKITIKGKAKTIQLPATIKRVAKGLAIKANFQLSTDDFKIEIPSIVREKISKNVRTQITCVLH